MQIKLTSTIKDDDYTRYIYDTYDLQPEHHLTTTIEYSLSNLNRKDWNIGVIIGNSGSGKSTILKSLGNVEEPVFDHDKPLISNFHFMSPKDASHLLTGMGLSSVPSWLRPYRNLSNGEQYRAKLAYCVAKASNDDIILIDEFTSVVDRTVARSMSFALQKYIRRSGKRIILASCHFDILEWLMPDWMCNLHKGGVLEKCDYLRQGRPKINLQVFRATCEAWHIFKKHHYLSDKINKAAKYFIFEWDGVPVCMITVINHVSGNVRKAVRGSRTIVLPDYQGLGIGKHASNFIAGVYKYEGYKYYVKTVNPALGEYRNNSDLWKATGKNNIFTKYKPNNILSRTSKHRASYCHEYAGSGIPENGELLLKVASLLDISLQKPPFLH